MAVNYKTSAADAQAMAQVWYSLVPSVAQSVTPRQLQQGIAWWTKQIQQDGSNTAFKNFQSGIAQQHGAQAAQQLAQNVAKLQQTSGLNPWQPDANTAQLPGTNTKIALGPSGGLLHGGSTGNTTIDGLLKAAAEIGAGALTGGAAAPLVGAAIGAGSTALTGGNLGQDLTAGITGAAAGTLGGGLAGASGAAGGAAGSAASTPGGIADASGMTANSTLGGIDSMTGQQLADASGMTANAAAGSGGAGGVLGSVLGGTSGAGGSSTGALGIPGLSWGDILKTVGGAASSVANYAQQQAALKQQAQEFAQTYGLQANQQAMTAQSQLNRAPLADYGQYMALHAAAPTAFQPRDYTQAGGFSNLSTPATGGPAAQLNANAITAANYQPGAGGVDTSTLQAILAKIKGAQGLNTTTTLPPR